MDQELGDLAEAEEQESTYHTPSSVLSAFSSALKVSLEQTTFKLRGVYTLGRNVEYSGFYYDRMEEEAGNEKITLRVPASVRAVMTPGAVHTVLGFVERRVWGDRGSIECQVRVIKLVEQEEVKSDPEAEARLEIIALAAQRSMQNPEQVLRDILASKEQPNIAILYGEGGIVDRDVMTALGAASAHYNIMEFRESFSNPSRISTTLKGLDNGMYDQIAVVRGGGSGLEVLDDLNLAKTATEMTTPLLVALGHEQDHPFLEKVACRCFPTPTSLGEWLKKVAEDTHEDLARSKAALVKEVEKQYADRIKGLEKQVEDTIKANGEQQKTIEGLQKQMEEARKSADEGRAASDEKSQEIISGLKEQLEASKKMVEGQTEQNKELNEKIEKLGQDFDLRRQEQSKQNGEALDVLKKQLESGHTTTEQQAKTIASLQAQTERLSNDIQNARKDADARYGAELSELRTIKESQAVEIARLKASTTKRLSLLWFVVALVVGLVLGLLVAVAVL